MAWHAKIYIVYENECDHSSANLTYQGTETKMLKT